MKSTLKVKLLNHIAGRKKGNEGFTLIELLVVVIIIGILAAIALPSFLNQANKAKQSEARQYVASLLKGQQVYYTENSAFIKDSDKIQRLGVGVPVETNEYDYTVEDAAIGSALSSVGVRATVKKADAPLKAYAGGVVALEIDADDTGTAKEIVTYSGLCESDTARSTSVAVGDIDEKGAVTCTDGKSLSTNNQ